MSSGFGLFTFQMIRLQGFIPRSPCCPGKPGLPGKPFLPPVPGSPRGPCPPGSPGGPGGPGLLLMPLGIWLSNVLTRAIWAVWTTEKCCQNMEEKRLTGNVTSRSSAGKKNFLLLTMCSQICRAIDRIMFWGAKSPWKRRQEGLHLKQRALCSLSLQMRSGVSDCSDGLTLSPLSPFGPMEPWRRRRENIQLSENLNKVTVTTWDAYRRTGVSGVPWFSCCSRWSWRSWRTLHRHKKKNDSWKFWQPAGNCLHYWRSSQKVSAANNTASSINRNISEPCLLLLELLTNQ